MKYARRVYRRRARKYMRRPRKSVATKKPSKFLKRTIQSMISKNVEDKQAFFSTGTSLTMMNSGITGQGDCQQVVPEVYQGSTEQHRIGDVIRGKSLVIRGYVQLAKDTTYNNASNSRVGVRLIVASSKRLKDWTGFAGSFGTGCQYLLQRGSTSLAFNGYINDLWTPINKEEYTVYYDKVHYLSQSYTVQQQGTSTPTCVWSTDLSKSIQFFTIRVPLRGKKILYDAVSGQYPTNFAPGLMCGYAHLDGSATDVVETKVGICYDVTMTYEDA